ncbi:Maf family protein [Pontibacillus marinus]|uniref:dTTP/UTP pyrophosphatase n=1 Tax=Pontibacillus marinus BH030004 = DSM 16465 TaxID=1385511 RepID=A0A0A5G4L2_9BACI|nr:Maf family protein [Pontibacillus marinus]KGX88046.1 septum formation protein Maf [Pontibacillus marinus BH030004 = DSM 16465]
MNNQLILASSSPRRRELLNQVNIQHIVRKQDVDESNVPFYNPRTYVQTLAERKGRSIGFESDQEVILSADTIVCYEDKVLEKPNTREEAFQMLRSLSGQKHQVYTGVMLRSPEQEMFIVDRTTVEFWPLSKEDIELYLDTGDSFDKAGGYGIQTEGAMLVKQISGDYNTVVGLPLSRVVRSLRTFGIYPSISEMK